MGISLSTISLLETSKSELSCRKVPQNWMTHKSAPFPPKSNLISNPEKDKPSAMIWQKNGQGINEMNKFKKVILEDSIASLLAQQIKGRKTKYHVSVKLDCLLQRLVQHIWQIVWIKRHFFVAKQTSGKQSKNTGQGRTMAPFSTAHCTCALPGVLQNESTPWQAHLCEIPLLLHQFTLWHKPSSPYTPPSLPAVVVYCWKWNGLGILVCGILRYLYKLSSTFNIHILFIQLSFT